MKRKQLPPKERQRLLHQYGEWAVVTGASSGIGLELARQLAEARFNLIINSRHPEDLRRVVAELESEFSIKVIPVAADVGSLDGVSLIVKHSDDRSVGLFVAAAGFGTSGSFIDNSMQKEVEMLQVNCEGLLRLTHYFGRRFAAQRRGGIILLSSIVAFQGVPFSANYAATKAFVQSLAEGLSKELKPFHVDVLAAAPGPVASNFGARANMKMSKMLLPSEIGAPILKALGRRSIVLPGLLTKVLVYSLGMLPRWGKVSVMGKVMRGFTEHQTVRDLPDLKTNV